MNIANIAREGWARAHSWRGASTAALALSALVALPAQGVAQIDKEAIYQGAANGRSNSLFNLDAGPTAVLEGNQFQCGLSGTGQVCVNIFNSPTGGGGFWPTGSPNQYMFQAGLQVAGIVPPGAGFPWAGDTVGAYFVDTRGDQEQGAPVSLIYNSLNEEDLANWPGPGDIEHFPNASAYVQDTTLFTDVVIGRKTASQQDSWVMYWDGDPGNNPNREHAMGILVEQRSLAWNYPAGNEATVYFIWKFTNVTNNAFFQETNEEQFFQGANLLPDEGWPIDSIYVSFTADPDVTVNFDRNYSSAILPFNMGLAYNGEFTAPGFVFPPELFHPPFFEEAVGIVGVKYLQSPVDSTGQPLGLTLFSVFENGGLFPDAFGTDQLWRYLSGNLNPGLGDSPCTFANPKDRRICYLAQDMKDTRFYQASGPFSLDPGESQTVVVAMLAAATVETPRITVGGDNAPGIPTNAPSCNGNPLRDIEVAAGWLGVSSCPPAGEPIEQFDVDVVSGSLLGKAITAQTIFNGKFLLPFAPVPPQFTATPGEGQVTITWEPSATVQAGDPFIQAASDPSNALFNSNYREFDVEGYRIYRGTTPANLELIAQFDDSLSVYIDSTCETDPSFVPGDSCTTADTISIVSPLVQYGPGDVVRLEDGSELVVDADTVLAGAIASGNAQPLTNSGIPFTFVDTDVRNNFQYYYAVTAFDVNSLKSGPTSLESSAAPVGVFPQADSGTVTAVHTVPDPYYAVSLYDRNPRNKRLRFVNLPANATVRIYTVSGRLVDIVVHADPSGGGMETWDLRNRSGQYVASGVYFFHVSTPDGEEHIGKFTIVNSGGF